MSENVRSFIRLPKVMRRTGYSKAWLYRLINQNRFPKPVKIGERAIAFVEGEIDDWITQRIEARNAVNNSKPQL
ncbi:AlpA family transcriptional regulator [Salmonella enterica subsp. diarizonae serovar 60:r:z]|nr:AlpA family transcriptional regulator [Salmonella enterica subsp. diarizonae serovar 60:r:z]